MKLVNKKFLILCLSVFAFLFTSSEANSQNLPIQVGQRQNYDVLFRDNGEAVVSANFFVTKNAGEPMKFISFNVDNFDARSLQVWQRTYEESCQWYDSQILNNERVGMEYCAPIDQTVSANDSLNRYTGTSSFFENPKYFKTNVWEWKEAKTILENGELKVELPQPWYSGEFQLLLRYRGFGYVSKGLFGRRNFGFKNFTTDSEIQKVNVTVKVDTDLYFQGKKSSISFVEEQFAVAPAVTDTFGLNQKTSAPIDYRFALMTKTANNLAQGEIFTVKGIYSSSKFGLNYPVYFAWMGGFVLMVVGMFYLVRFVKRRKKLIENKSANTAQIPSTSVNNVSGLSSLEDIIWSFYGAIMFTISLFLLFFVINKLTYGGYGYLFDEALLTILFLLLFLVVMVLFFGMPMYRGYVHGLRNGIKVLGWQVLFIIIFAIIIVFVLYLITLSKRSNQYPVYPYQGSSYDPYDK